MYGHQFLKKTLARTAPPPLARLIRRVTAHPRFWRQRARCRRAYREHGRRYAHNLLFIAGLPKSGTSWLEQMVASFPGLNPTLIGDVIGYELDHGQSHDYDLPDDFAARFDGALAMTKMHVHGSPHNVEILHRGHVPYVVLHRDLRDVSVSHFYYVSQTPWHPEFPVYRRLSLQEGLALFALRTLPEYAAWVRSWHDNRDPQRSLMLRYEDLLTDPAGGLEQVARLFGIEASEEERAEILEACSFRRLSGGRDRGQEASGSFVRKGVAGDWRNHFTPPLVDLYKAVIGDFLIEYGYERDLDWDAANGRDAAAAVADAPAEAPTDTPTDTPSDTPTPTAR